MIYTASCKRRMFHPTIHSTTPILSVESHPWVGDMNPQGHTSSYGCLQTIIIAQNWLKTHWHNSYSNFNHANIFPIGLHNPRDDILFSPLKSLRQYPPPLGIQHKPVKNLSNRGSNKSNYNRSSHTTSSPYGACCVTTLVLDPPNPRESSLVLDPLPSLKWGKYILRWQWWQVKRKPLKTSFRHGREGNRPEWLRTSHRWVLGACWIGSLESNF